MWKILEFLRRLAAVGSDVQAVRMVIYDVVVFSPQLMCTQRLRALGVPGRTVSLEYPIERVEIPEGMPSRGNVLSLHRDVVAALERLCRGGRRGGLL